MYDNLVFRLNPSIPPDRLKAQEEENYNKMCTITPFLWEENKKKQSLQDFILTAKKKLKDKISYI